MQTSKRPRDRGRAKGLFSISQPTIGTTTRLAPNSLSIGVFISNPELKNNDLRLGWALYRTTSSEAHMYAFHGYSGSFPGLYAATPPGTAICFYNVLTFRSELYTDEYQHSLINTALEMARANGAETLQEGLAIVLDALCDEHCVEVMGTEGNVKDFVRSLEIYAWKVLDILRKLPPTSWAPLWPDPRSTADGPSFSHCHI